MGHQYNNQHPPSTSDVFDIWSNQNQKQGAPQSSCDQQHNNSQQEVLPMHQPLQLQSSSQYTPTPPRTIRKLYDTTTSSTSPPPQSTVNQLHIPPNSTIANSTHTNNNDDSNIVVKNRPRLNTSEESHTTFTTKEQHSKQQTENEEDLVNQLRKELAECQAELLEVRARAGTASPSIALQGSRISSPIPIMGGNSAIPLNSPIIPTTTTTNNRSRLNTADNSTTIPVLGSRSRLNTSESISIPQSPSIPQSVPIVQHTVTKNSSAESMNINRVRLNTGESSDNMQSCSLQQHQTRSRLDTTDSEALTVPVFNSASCTSQYNIGGGQIDDSRRTQRVSNRTNIRITALDLLNVDNYNEAANNVVYLQSTPVVANKRSGGSNLMKESVPPLPLVDTVHNKKVDDGFDDDDSVDYLPDKGIKHKNPVLQLNEENKIIVNNELRTTGGNSMEEKKDFTSIIDQMKLFPPPPPKNNYDDGASDVSSLTDAVSYQTSPKLKGRKSSTSITSEGEKQQQSAGVGSTMMAMAALSLRKKKPKNIQRASTSHTLETIDNSMEQNLYDAASSSSRQRREHLFPSRRGRQHQMRLSLPLEGHWGGGSFAPVDEQHNKPQVIFPSPLSEAIERESRLSLSTTGSLGSSKQQHRRVQSSMEDLTRKFNSHHLQQHKQHHHYRSASNGSTSIQSSWLIPTADQPESSARHNESPGTQGTPTTTQMTDEATNTTIPTIQLPPLQTATIGRPEDDDLIDISYDVPIDPFSGLIGMPKSSGDSIGSGDVPSVEPLLWDNMFGGSTRNHTNSSSSRPPIGKQRSKSVASSSLVVDEFDPLLLANINESEEMTSVHSNSVSSMSPLRSSAVPPRHYKDDPLLSKSKYRHPLLISGQLQQQQQQQQSNNHRPSTVEKKTKKKKHQRSSSLGASITNSNLGNACMFGTIAQLEAHGTHPTESMVITTASMSRNVSCASLDWDGSITSLTDQNSVVGHGNVVAATTGLSQLHATLRSDGAEEEGASTSSFLLCTPNSVQDLTVVNIVPPTNLVDNKDECNTNTVNDDDDGENSSYGSFSEEYHRPEQKHKGVVREVKHIMKPMVKVGRKLLGRGSDDASMKRADGCLT